MTNRGFPLIHCTDARVLPQDPMSSSNAGPGSRAVGKLSSLGRSFLERNRPYFASRCLHDFSDWMRGDAASQRLHQLCDELATGMAHAGMPFESWEKTVLKACSENQAAFATVR